MSQKNHRHTACHELQSRFTAYLQRAVHNKRIDYLYKQRSVLQTEQLIEDSVQNDSGLDEDFVSTYDAYDHLRYVLRNIKERERYILLARVLEEKSFAQIGAETGMSGKGAAAVYYRTLKKLRGMLGDEK